MILHIGAQTLDLSHPVVMTIINVTPDSFYAGSRTSSADQIRHRITEAVNQGAALLDVGGYSSRPGAEDVPSDEEIGRIDRAMRIIRHDFPDMPVSIDTFRSETIREIVRRHGPCIVNDITGGDADPQMFTTAAELSLPFIAMHMRGKPDTMQTLTQYADLTAEIYHDLQEKRDRLHAAGVREVILDPGFGFAKTTDQNYELLAQLHRLSSLGCPILAGISRKSMIYKILESSPAEALNGTTALHWECLRQGASILRVHDTQAAVEVIRLFGIFRKNTPDQKIDHTV